MEQTQINFRQERDFGEIFNATFSFIKQEFKTLAKAILYFVLPAMLIASILMVFVSIRQQEAMREITGGDPYSMTNPFSVLGGMFPFYIFIMLLYAFAFTVSKCTIYGYVKLYVDKGKDNFTLNEIWDEVKKNFFPLLGTSIVVGFVIGIGFIFCIIPGIYLGISLSLIYMVLIFEGNGFSDAFNRSFKLTKKDWWLTFGLIVVAFIMIYAVTMLFSIPGIVLGLKPLITNMGTLDEADMFNFSIGYYIINSITTLIMYVLLMIPALIIAFHYFSLVESREQPSLEDKINQI